MKYIFVNKRRWIMSESKAHLWFDIFRILNFNFFNSILLGLTLANSSTACCIWTCTSQRILSKAKKKEKKGVGPWKPHELRLFSPLLTPLFREHSFRVFSVLFYVTSKSCETDFNGQVVYKPWVLSVSFEALMPITAGCVPLLHQLVIEPVTIHLM